MFSHCMLEGHVAAILGALPSGVRCAQVNHTAWVLGPGALFVAVIFLSLCAHIGCCTDWLADWLAQAGL